MAYSLKKNLDTKSSRPSIHIPINSKTTVRCLVDTGANMPVWTSGEELFKKAFAEAELQTDLTFIISGFGTGTEEAPVYKIPKFTIKSDYTEDFITFNNLLVACCTRPSITFPMILSATMFNKTNYSIINVGKEAQTFQIEHEKREYEIGKMISTYNNKTVSKIYSFIQD